MKTYWRWIADCLHCIPDDRGYGERYGELTHRDIQLSVGHPELGHGAWLPRLRWGQFRHAALPLCSTLSLKVTRQSPTEYGLHARTVLTKLYLCLLYSRIVALSGKRDKYIHGICYCCMRCVWASWFRQFDRQHQVVMLFQLVFVEWTVFCLNSLRWKNAGRCSILQE